MCTRLSLVTLLWICLLPLTNPVFAQNCAPSNSCLNAPKLCLDGYVGLLDPAINNGGSATVANCFNTKEKKQRQFIAFTPVLPALKLTIDNLDPSAKSGIEAAIFDSPGCSGPPIACDTSSTQIILGGGVVFTPGQTYYLMLSAGTGVLTKYRTSYLPQDAILVPPNPIFSWPAADFIDGKKIVDCPHSDQFYSVPLNACANEYRWSIEKGNAVFLNDQPGYLTDLNPSTPLTRISLFGPKRNGIRLGFLSSGPVRLCVEGTSGCHSSSKTCITIEVKTAVDINKTVQLCSNVDAYIDPSIPGGPFYPGLPCKTPKNYNFVQTDPNGCVYTVNLNVSKFCENNYLNATKCDCPDGAFKELDTTLIAYCIKPLGTFGKIDTDTSANPNLKKVYILTDYNASQGVGKILASSNVGLFVFGNGLEFDKTYYISCVVGEKSLTGDINYNNPNKCLLISSQPVRFTKSPTALAPPLGSACGKSVVLQATALDGKGEWIVKKAPIGAKYSFSPSSAAPNATFSVTTKGTYTMQWKVTNGICTDSASTSVTFLGMPTFENLTINCNASGTSYTVSFKLVGVPPYKLLKGSNPAFIIGNTLTSLPIQNAKPYRFYIKDAQNCDTLKVAGLHICSTFGGVDDREAPAITPTTPKPDSYVLFTLSPNPATNQLTVRVNEATSAEITLLDYKGSILKQLSLREGLLELSIPLDEWPSGIYTCQINSQNRVQSKQFIIQK